MNWWTKIEKCGMRYCITVPCLHLLGVGIVRLAANRINKRYNMLLSRMRTKITSQKKVMKFHHRPNFPMLRTSLVKVSVKVTVKVTQ